MHEQRKSYEPEDMILCATLTEKGSKLASKRLAKEKKGSFPKTGTPDKFYSWWMQYKESKKKNKIAMVIMAFHYPTVVMHLDRYQSQVLQLEAKTKSQEQEINLLKLNLLQQDNKIMLLNDTLSEIRSEALKLKSKKDSQKKDINSLKQRVQEQEVENKQLKDEISNYNTTCDSSKNFLGLPGPVTRSLQRSLVSLLGELPDLQYDNSNYEFWAKIKSWLLKGEVAPWCVFELVNIKCPLTAWQAVEEKFDRSDLTEKVFSNPAAAGRLLEKLWKCVSKALGPGTKYFELYYYRRQKAGETFEQYLQEKFRLYCSYGVDSAEPDKNDRHFLCNVLENAAKSNQALKLQCPKSYTDLLTMAMLMDRTLIAAEWKNECLNCDRKGHTKAQCRRAGGDAEVGPNQCYTCGGYGHWAFECRGY